MKKYLILLIAGFLFFNSIKNVSASTSTDPNFKVAFIGDSSAGNNFQSVLNLIKQEGARMVLHQGDFDYSAGPQIWMDKINTTLGANFPYLGSDGNHDNWDTDGFAAFFKDRLVKMGLPAPSGSLPPSYAVVYKGLKIVFSKENGDPAFLQSQLAGDTHTWKICSWHKNQTAMQLGTKGDEQGWPDYETCRQNGAIIATGHEHTYERTKTLSSIQNQTIDSTCSDPKNLCVSPGRTFVFVSGLGGNGIRNQDRCLPTTFPYGCKGEWASVYTSDQAGTWGALFITFNYQGNPNRAHGYFKDLNNKVIDEFDVLTTGGSGGTVPPVTISQSPSNTPTGGGTTSPAPTGTGKPGDANGDNLVDGTDYSIWHGKYNQSATGAANGDFDGNGVVDGQDYVIWLNNYNK